MKLIDIVLPVFLVIALGYVLRRRGFVGAAMNAWLSRLVFYVAAPALLFHSTARGSFAWGKYIPILLVTGGVTVLVAIGAYVVARRMTPARRGVFAQGCQRSNTVFFGLPVVLNAFGESVLSLTSIVIAFLVVVENLLAVLVLTLPHRKQVGSGSAPWLHTLVRVLTNPLTLSCVGGILYSTLGVPLPISLDRGLEMIGSTAAPLGLLCVGAGLDYGSLRREIPTTALVAGVRLIVHPALIYGALRLAGLSGTAVSVPVLIMACPTAVVSYIMAREMEGDAELAAAIIIGTTVLSLATLVGWLGLLRVV